MLVYTTGHGVNGFTLDPSIGEFCLSHPNMRMPETGRIYAMNEGNIHECEQGVKDYISFCQEVQADGNRYLVLENGYRYDGNPGQADYRAIKYDTYGVLLPKPEVSEEVTDREAIPTSQLFGQKRLRERAELQWRLSLPILVFVVTLLAVPLSRVNPRQGRFLKLLPAILLYMAYLTMLISVRGALEKGKLPIGLGMWWVHGLFLLIGLGLLYWEPMRLKRAARRAEVAHG